MAMLTADEAYAKHIEMWKAMQEKLGDKPGCKERVNFKIRWCERHEKGPVRYHCYLCQYTYEQHLSCYGCPVDWGNEPAACIGEHVDYAFSPISEILALPRREVSDGSPD